MSVGPFDSRPSQRKNFTPSEKRRVLDELLKLSKIGALNYGFMKKFLT